MATVVYVYHLGPPSRIFQKKFVYMKNAVTFLETSRKHIFTASNTRKDKNRVDKKKLKQILSKMCSNFNLHS